MATCKHCGGSGEDPDWRELGARVRQCRETSGLSLRELARRLGLSAPFVSDLELGRRGFRGAKAATVLNFFGLEENDAN